MDGTNIEWTQAPGFKGATWNPFRGTAGKWHCVHVSPGCQNCYAESLNQRFGGPKYRVGADSSRLDAEVLAQPLRWRRPRMIFVCSMTDLFLEEHTDEQIAAVFGVMAACPQHTFQVLTKRAKRMREWFEWVRPETIDTFRCIALAGRIGERFTQARNIGKGSQWAPDYKMEWPLPWVWLGVSCEDQQRADERIPELLRCPAVVRWVSAEPLIAPIDFRAVEMPDGDSLGESLISFGLGNAEGLDWVVVGGESGPKARPMDIDWARSIVQQCKAARVPCFLKQLGAVALQSEVDPHLDPATRKRRVLEVDREWPAGTHFGNRTGNAALNGRQVLLRHPKGGAMEEWPEDLRVRAWPMPGQGEAT